MNVIPYNFNEAMSRLNDMSVVTVDTETTGLRPYHGDKLFSIAVNEYYFNFKDYGDQYHSCLDWEYCEAMRSFFETERTWIFANAKFDMAMLENGGFGRPRGKIIDVLVNERLLDDQSHKLTLDTIAPHYGTYKDDTVEQYIECQKLYTMVEVPGRQQKQKNMHYDMVPFELISKYCVQDVLATFKVAKGQIDAIKKIDDQAEDGWPRLREVYENECRLLPVVYDMEKRGVKVDLEFCKRAIEHEQMVMEESAKTFEALTGKPYKKSPKVFSQVFADQKDKWVYTDKGNPKFDMDTLGLFGGPIAESVVRHSQAKSNINYYKGFEYHADTDGRIHTSLNQFIPRTGRFSSSSPNLQNLKKRGVDLTKPFVVRRAIVPEEGNFFGMIDYDQVEYRLMVDYAGALDLIRMINEDGLDVHSATAEIAGVSRDEAKNVNFGIVYGQGDESLGHSLGVSTEEAKQIRWKILAAAPEIEAFVETVKHKAKTRGFIFNWLGRRYHYDRQTSYKAPNGLIQGGAADVIKVAMVRCDEFLKDYKTELKLCIHDELVFEGPKEELNVLSELKGIMETVYPFKHLKLTAGIDVSFKSLADKVPYEEVV